MRKPAGRRPRTKRCCGSAWQPPGHWTQRPDCTSTNLSIGYWQTARIYALLGQAENARRYAQMCFEVSQQPGVKAVFLAYAYEALARAEAAAGEKGIAYGYLTEARRLAEQSGRGG